VARRISHTSKETCHARQNLPAERARRLHTASERHPHLCAYACGNRASPARRQGRARCDACQGGVRRAGTRRYGGAPPSRRPGTRHRQARGVRSVEVGSSVTEGVEPGTPLHRRLSRFPRAAAPAALLAILPYPVRRRVSSPRVAARRCPGPSPVHSGGCGHIPGGIPYGQNTRTRPYRRVYDSAIAQAVACMLPTPSRILSAERG
jgi:hypothetical protein